MIFALCSSPNHKLIKYREPCQALENRTFREAHYTAQWQGDRKHTRAMKVYHLCPVYRMGIDGITCESGTSTIILDMDWSRCDESEDTTGSPQTLRFVGKSI